MKKNIRNIAIIAHVDHGKTSLVDQLLRQTKQVDKANEENELIMDSNPLEKERGITILSKNCALKYINKKDEEYHINIIDTPGHADFSGEVERVLMMADGALLLVDSFEGVMPQTKYVLQKALERKLKPILVINKMDRENARPEFVVDQIFELIIELGGDDDSLDFPILYSSAKNGWACTAVDKIDKASDIFPILDTIVDAVPEPKNDKDANLQALITNIDYSEYLGRIAIGRVYAGELKKNLKVKLVNEEQNIREEKIASLFGFVGLGREETEVITAGDLFAVSGLKEFNIGDTISSFEDPQALSGISVDMPTLQMTFRINDGPFSGRDGKYVTSRQIKERLEKELKYNVALRLEEKGDEFLVSGRGILHLGILIENMRREGFELTVGKAQVIILEDEHGKKQEPIESLQITVPNDFLGAVMELLGDRQAEMLDMKSENDDRILDFKIPSRGLIGMRSKLLTATQGKIVMAHRFLEYDNYKGEIKERINGSLIATEQGKVTSHAVELLADRGILFLSPGEDVYSGQVVGEHSRSNDLPVNITRTKKLNNIRSATKEQTVTLKKAHKMDLETALEYIQADELVEITPKSVRLRKKYLSENERKRRSRSSSTA